MRGLTQQERTTLESDHIQIPLSIARELFLMGRLRFISMHRDELLVEVTYWGELALQVCPDR